MENSFERTKDIGEIMEIKSKVAENDYVPETLDWCDRHYTPPVKKYITCEHFGKSDGMSGGCQWCKEMTPYQWRMCEDESMVRSYMSPMFGGKTREEAKKTVEESKKLYFLSLLKEYGYEI